MTKKNKDTPAENKTITPELSLLGLKKRPISPLNDSVWKLILIVSSGCFGAWLIPRLFGFGAVPVLWLVAALTVTAWLFAVRLLLLDSKARKFWLIWLIVGALPLVWPAGSNMTWISVTFSFFFLLLRRYRPYRHLTSRRQTWLFLIGIFLFILIAMAWQDFVPSGPPPASTVDAAVRTPGLAVMMGQRLLGYSLGSLRFFWFFSLFNLFFSIRLQFMRLKPKLAVSALLIAVFPIVLVAVMGVSTIYTLLGESRALRARALLEDWAALAALDPHYLPALSKTDFLYQENLVPAENPDFTGEKPDWLDEFILALKSSGNIATAQELHGSSQYYWISGQVWLIVLSPVEAPALRLQGCRLDNQMLERAAAIINCEIELYQSNPINLRPLGERPPRKVSLEQKDVEAAIRGALRSVEERTKAEPESGSRSFWQKPQYFGMSDVDVIMFSEGRFEKRSLLLATKASLAGIFGELLSKKNPITQIALSALIAIAFVLMIFEAVALLFGIRIATGITRAIRSLHRGARRIAAGDLDTPTEIPNEDELGDLAFSFNQMALAVKKGREEAVAREILERELRNAREIQQRLLPHEMPQVPGFEICGTSLPSRQVGGDYFDFIEMESGILGVAVGDVSGKGLPAALLMANLQASLHAQVLSSRAVGELVGRLNNLLVRSTDKHMFATFFYGLLDRNLSTFTWANAGHNPPILLRSSGEVERLKAGGLILGFLADQVYHQKEVGLEPGDVLVLYTDGITEASAPRSEKEKRELFGEDRLLDVVRSGRDGTAPEIQARILEAISGYTAGTPQEDDITLVIIKRTPA
jgi:serine phosphatase RsbU (regulator of sigma subunit)